MILLGWNEGQAFGEGLGGGAATHAAALVRPAMMVAVEIGVENRLHLLDGLEPGAPAFDPEVLVEQGTVQALDDAVRLRPADPGGLVHDVLELKEQLVGMAVGPATELAAVVAEHGVDGGAVGLEGRQTSASSSCTAVTGSLFG